MKWALLAIYLSGPPDISWYTSQDACESARKDVHFSWGRGRPTAVCVGIEEQH